MDRKLSYYHSKKKREEDSSHYKLYDLDIFWKLIQEDSSLSPALKDSTMQILIELIKSKAPQDTKKFYLDQSLLGITSLCTSLNQQEDSKESTKPPSTPGKEKSTSQSQQAQQSQGGMGESGSSSLIRCGTIFMELYKIINERYSRPSYFSSSSSNSLSQLNNTHHFVPALINHLNNYRVLVKKTLALNPQIQVTQIYNYVGKGMMGFLFWVLGVL